MRRWGTQCDRDSCNMHVCVHKPIMYRALAALTPNKLHHLHMHTHMHTCTHMHTRKHTHSHAHKHTCTTG